MAVDNNNSTTPINEKDFAQTPPGFMVALRELLGYVPDLDVCAQPQTAKAPVYYCLAEGCDALALPWASVNWCNPPFSSVLPWVKKAAEEMAAGNTTIMIFPDSPETAYCRASFDLATAIYHMPFRMRFLRPDGSDFLDLAGRVASPKFATRLVIFDPSKPRQNGRPLVDYFDPRAYLDGVKSKKGRKA